MATVAKTGAQAQPGWSGSLSAPGQDLPTGYPAHKAILTKGNGIKIIRIADESQNTQSWQNGTGLEYSHPQCFVGDCTQIKSHAAAQDSVTYNRGAIYPYDSRIACGWVDGVYGFPFGTSNFSKCNNTGGGSATITNVTSAGMAGGNAQNGTRIGDSEGQLSYDDSKVALNDSSNIVVYNINTNTYTNKLSVPANYNWASVSPSGRYLVIAQSDFAADPNYRRMWRYEINGNVLENGALLFDWEEHHAWLQDTTGDDWIYHVGSHMFIRVKDGLQVTTTGGSGFGYAAGCKGVPGYVAYGSNGTIGITRLSPQNQGGADISKNVSDSRNMIATNSYVYKTAPNIANSFSNWAPSMTADNTTHVNLMPGGRILWNSNWNGAGTKTTFEAYAIPLDADVDPDPDPVPNPTPARWGFTCTTGA